MRRPFIFQCTVHLNCCTFCLEQPFGAGLVTVVVPQLKRGENSLYLWKITAQSELQPIHTFVGHKDVVLEFQWKKQPEGKHWVGTLVLCLSVFFTMETSVLCLSVFCSMETPVLCLSVFFAMETSVLCLSVFFTVETSVLCQSVFHTVETVMLCLSVFLTTEALVLFRSVFHTMEKSVLCLNVSIQWKHQCCVWACSTSVLCLNMFHTVET